MGERDVAVEREASALPGPLFLALTALSAAMIFSLLVITLAPAFQRKANATAVSRATSSSQEMAAPRRLTTIVYIVDSESEAQRLRLVFEQRDQATRDRGLEVDLRRMFLVGTPDDPLMRSLEITGLTRAGSGGVDLRVIDLRN